MQLIKRTIEWLKTGKPHFRRRKSVKEITRDEKELIIDLLYEEVEELRVALVNNDKKEILDAVIDIQVVASNPLAAGGFSLKEIEEHRDKVLASNDSKYCDTEEEAKGSVFRYLCGDHPDKFGEVIRCYYKDVGGKFVVYREGDDKIMKSYKYREV